MRALEMAVAGLVFGGLVALAPGGGRVPGHRCALFDGDQHVSQRVLHRLELADGPPELDAYLGVLRRRLQTPAGDARTLGRHERQGQATDVLVGDQHLLMRRNRQAALTDGQLTHRTRGVERRQSLDRDGITQRFEVQQDPARTGTRPVVERHQDQPRRRQPEHRAHGAPQGEPPVLRRLPGLRRRAQRHRSRDGTVSQPAHPFGRHGGGPPWSTGEGGGDQERRQQGSGEQRVPQLFEHHDQLRQREALPSLLLGQVQAEPALRGHLLPGRR